jgi:tetratricopeptide (TPR) repeat protein
MAFNFEAASRLFRDGEYLALIQASGRTDAERAAHEPRHRVLLANSLALIGQLESAQRLAELDRHPPASLSIRSQAESTLCVVERRLGNHNAAQRHAQAALLYAQESNDTERIAWAQLHLFRLLIEIGPADKALSALADTRRLVAKAGSNDASAYLHICVSVLEGQIGRLDEAKRHCDIADGLLGQSTNAWLSASCLINRGCIEWLNCQFVQASKLFRVGRAKAMKIGHSYLTQAADTCDAHVQLFLGRFEDAEQAFSKISRDAASDIASQLGSLDGLARVYLAAGRFRDAERVIGEIRQRTNRTDPTGAIYYVRWAAITEARLLIKSGRYADAIAVLDAAEDRFRNQGDAPLSVAIHLTQAQALIRQGDGRLAGSRIVRASELGATRIRDLQAEYYYGCSLTISDRPLVQHLQRRARSLWAFHDVVAVQHELDNTMTSPAERNAPLGESDSFNHFTSCVIDSLASLNDVAHHPKLLADELTFVIRSIDCAEDVRVVHSEAAHESDPTTSAIRFQIANNVALTCTIPETTTKAVLLADVLRMGRAALELDRARKAERNRAAVWPATPVEEQAGALFLAEEMQTLLATARRIATTNVPVLITGGTRRKPETHFPSIIRSFLRPSPAGTGVARPQRRIRAAA